MANRSTKTDPAKLSRYADLRADGGSVRGAAREAGITYGSAQRAEKRERIKDRLRKKDEFAATDPLRAPRRNTGIFSWSLEAIRKARDDQMRGKFFGPVMLARALRTDTAMFSAYHNRIAPQSAIEALLVAKPGDRGERARARALVSCVVPRATLAGINGTLANHGLAIGYIEQEVNDEGTRVDFRLTEWPLEFVEWDESRECLMTRTRDNPQREAIVHGDGRWVVFRKFDRDPWTQEACLIPGAILWYGHMNGMRDWGGATSSHGRPKLLGELPAGVSGQDGSTTLTPEMSRYLAMLADLADGEIPAGVAPSGSKTTLLYNGSTAWQIFDKFGSTLEKAAARIYLGTDATMGSQGGAPGVDIAALFGVATTKIQGDFTAIEEALRTGFYEPWAAMNYGDSAYAPMLVYQLPDTDSQKQIDDRHARLEKFFAALEKYKANGMTVDQAVLNALAAEYKVTAPILSTNAARAVPITVTPSTNEKIFTIDELRMSQGGTASGTPRGSMTITQAEEADKAAAEARLAAQQAEADAAAAANAPPPAAEPAAVPA
jgi:molybdenum-dependent DNA-binding transcriptional regulator ModE